MLECLEEEDASVKMAIRDETLYLLHNRGVDPCFVAVQRAVVHGAGLLTTHLLVLLPPDTCPDTRQGRLGTKQHKTGRLRSTIMQYKLVLINIFQF